MLSLVVYQYTHSSRTSHGVREMESLIPTPKMSLDGDLSENWERFYQRFDMCLFATNNHAKGDKIKCNILLLLITNEEQGRKVFNNFTFAEGEETKLDVVVAKFKDYCCPKRNETFERYKFFSRKQAEFEKFDDFVRDLRTLSNTCSFDDLQESLIRAYRR